MVIPHDIYDADAKNMLLRQGLILASSHIESIRRINGGRDTINVSDETHKMMIQHLYSSRITSQKTLEEDTGYKSASKEASLMIKEIEQSRNMPLDALYAVTDDLSNILDIIQPDLLLNLVNALAPVDEYLQRHSVNVSLLNGLIGKWLNLPKKTVDTLLLVGLVHDCGKVSVPPQILNAPRGLAAAEFEVVKMHPVFSHDLLYELPQEVRLGVRGHHEKFKGKGYPDNLSDYLIPLTARITAVSDIYDAMVSRRSYKPPQNPFNIIADFKKLSGTMLDPQVIETFVQNIPKELVNKPYMLSNGEIGIVKEIDYDDIEFPYIQYGTKVIKSSDELHCVHMYFEENVFDKL
jgi:HD-GYP domain-containing protein (c-di-GMP phosphodiesterase class II)